jgi:hypothetical protein
MNIMMNMNINMLLIHIRIYIIHIVHILPPPPKKKLLLQAYSLRLEPSFYIMRIYIAVFYVVLDRIVSYHEFRSHIAPNFDIMTILL